MKQALFEPEKMTPAANDAWKLINYIRFVSIEDIHILPILSFSYPCIIISILFLIIK